MALIKCHECGNQVSTNAKTCPRCGAKVKKPVGKLGYILVALLVVWIISIANHEPVQTPAKTPEQIKADAAMQRAANGAALLKKAMNNPASFKLDEALVIDGTGAACYSFHAQNGFGAIMPGYAVLSGDAKKFKTNTMDGFREVWNKECAHKKGTIATTAINWTAL